MSQSDQHLEGMSSTVTWLAPDFSNRLRESLPFTQRQIDVLRELAKSQSNKQIGRALALSPETVNHHLKAIYLKLGVSTREDAVVEARRRGIID